MLPPTDIDHAAWKRMVSTKEGCAITQCTKRPVIAVTVTAVEITGSRGGTKLASDTLRFCPTHAEQRFAASLSALKGTRTNV